jgi:hypothetical protein
MGTDVDLLKHPVVSAAVGTAAIAVGAAEAAYRVAEKVPVFGPLMRRGVIGLSERGDQWRRSQRVSLLVGLVRATCCVLFPIGLLWAVVDRQRRSLQDIVFRTRVIYLKRAR